MTDTARWAIVTGIGVVSLIFGGGWAWKTYWRIKGLVDHDDLKQHFWTRAEQDAFAHSYEQWKDRVHEDFLQPFRQQTQALFNQSIAIAEHAKTLEHLTKAVDAANDRLEELVDESRKRVNDPK